MLLTVSGGAMSILVSKKHKMKQNDRRQFSSLLFQSLIMGFKCTHGDDAVILIRKTSAWRCVKLDQFK